MTVAKPGNPHGAPPGSPLTKVTLMIDEETMAELAELERARPNVRGRRSTIIREALRAGLKILQKSRK